MIANVIDFLQQFNKQEVNTVLNFRQYSLFCSLSPTKKAPNKATAELLSLTVCFVTE